VTFVEDSECVGYPLMHKIGHSVDQVEVLVLEDRRISVCYVSNMWISFGPAESILKNRQSEHVVHHHICSSLTLCEFLGGGEGRVISFPPYLPDLVPYVVSFPRTQDCFNGEKNLWYYHDFRKITECVCLVSNNALHKVLQVMAQLLGLLYKYPRMLF
jgi:hypothetical protein